MREEFISKSNIKNLKKRLGRKLYNY